MMDFLLVATPIDSQGDNQKPLISNNDKQCRNGFFIPKMPISSHIQTSNILVQGIKMNV